MSRHQNLAASAAIRSPRAIAATAFVVLVALSGCSPAEDEAAAPSPEEPTAAGATPDASATPEAEDHDTRTFSDGDELSAYMQERYEGFHFPILDEDLRSESTLSLEAPSTGDDEQDRELTAEILTDVLGRVTWEHQGAIVAFEGLDDDGATEISWHSYTQEVCEEIIQDGVDTSEVWELADYHERFTR